MPRMTAEWRCIRETAAGAVVFRRNFLVDLDSAVERAGEWRILDHGNVVLARQVADLAGDHVCALGDADRRIHAALVFEGDGEMRRIGDNMEALGTAAISLFGALTALGLRERGTEEPEPAEAIAS